MAEIDLGAVFRSVRRELDLSQREWAERVGVPLSTIARIESGAVTDPRFRTVERLLSSVGVRFVPELATADDDDGEYLDTSPVPHESLRDSRNQHYPAHLDVFETFPWFDRDGGALPAGTRVRTHHRNRGLRDDQRNRELPSELVTIDFHEVEPAQAWRWTALCGDRIVGHLSARSWPAALRPPAPPRPAVLCCLVMRPDWVMKGVERRLIARLRETIAQHGDDVHVVTLAYPGLPWGYIKNLGFHRAIRGIELVQLSR